MLNIIDFAKEANELSNGRAAPALPRQTFREVGKGILVPTQHGTFALPSSVKPIWAPQGNQIEFLRDTTTPEILLHGGRGGGKSEALLVSFLQHVGVGHGKHWRGVIFRNEDSALNDLKDKLQRLILDAFKGAKLVTSPHIVATFPDGETLRLQHLNDSNDYAQVHGASFPFIAFDELTNWPTDALYRQAISLCRSGNPNVPRIVRACTNPGSRGHGWVKSRFITADDPSRRAIQLTLEENKAFLQADPLYRQKIERACLDGNQRKAWLENSWDITVGGALDDLWNPKFHVLRPFKIPQRWRVDRSFDWGCARPGAVLWFAESNGEPQGPYGRIKGDLFVIAEWYIGREDEENEGLRLDAQTIAKNILAKERNLGLEQPIRSGPADNAIWSGDPSNPQACVANEMQAAGVRWLPANKSPGSRIAGLQAIRSRLQAVLASPRENKGLFVFDTCRHLLRTVPVLPRDPRNADDVDSSAPDHVYDALRYRVTHTPHTIICRSF